MTNLQIVEVEKMVREIEEDLYTYIEWKARGYQVRKGEKAAVNTKLWKQVKDKATGEQKFYFVKASLFSKDQVDKIA